MDLAVAFRPLSVDVLGGVQITNPIINRLRASVGNVDRLVRRQVSNEALHIPDKIVNGLRGLEAIDNTGGGLCHVRVLATIGFLTQFERDLSLGVRVAKAVAA